MALTAQERILYFQAAGIPSLGQMQFFDVYLGAGRQVYTYSVAQAIGIVDDFLALLSAAQEELLQELLAEFKDVWIDPTEIATGGAGIAPGLRYSSEEVRNLIRDRIFEIVPIGRKEYFERRKSGQDLGISGGRMALG